MFRQAGKGLAILAMALVPLACTSLPKPGTPGEDGEVALDSLETTDAVPLAYGDLEAVVPLGPTASGLWFEDDSGTVRLVGYDHQTRRLWPGVRVIRRQ